jgi:PAS domain S-box-containing protein
LSCWTQNGVKGKHIRVGRKEAASIYFSTICELLIRTEDQLFDMIYLYVIIVRHNNTYARIVYTQPVITPQSRKVGKMNKQGLRKCFAALLCVVFICFFSTGISGASPQTIKVGIYENNPKIFTNDKGNPAGFWPEIINYIATEEGWDIQYVHGSWSECLEKLKNGEIDMMPDVAYTEERAATFQFSQETVYTSWTQVYTKPGAKIQSIIDLEGKIVAVLKGSVNVEGPDGIKALVKAFNISCTFDEADSYNRVFDLVRSGEADAGVASKDFGYRNLRDYGLTETSIIFQPARIYFAFPKKAALNQNLIERVDFQIEKLKADSGSVYYRSLNKWLAPQSGSGSFIPIWIIWTLVGIGVLVLLLGAGVYIFRLQLRKRTGELTEEIAQREKAEQSIRLSEAKYSTLVERSNDGIIIIQDGLMAFLNQRMISLSGYNQEEVIGKPFIDFIAPKYKSIVAERYLHRTEGESVPERYEAELAAKGRTIAVEINANLIEYQGKPATMAIIRDITEQNKMWEILRDRETRLSVIYDNVSDIVFVIDAEPDDCFRFVSVNRRFLEVTGLSTEQIIGKKYQEVIPPTAQAMVFNKYKEAINTGLFVHWEEISEYPAGTKYGEITIVPVRDADGKYTRLIGTVHDITERKQSEIELEKYRDHLEELVKKRTKELEQANLHKSQFLANMSHELRTPLNSIIGYTKLLLDGMEGSITADQRDDLQTVYDNSKHLLSLINDLLDLSKIEAGKFEVVKEEFAVSELLSKIFPGMEKLARDKGLDLSYSVETGIEKIYADKNKTKQVLFNLIGNAIKFTQKGGVKLEINKNEHEFVFSVVDSGVGIAKEDLLVLFNSYKQVGPARLDGYEGTGLGLVISKQFVELQGGRIWVESKVGEGSKFSFSIPEK